MAVHDWMLDPRNHLCGQLHGPVLALIHRIFDRVQNLCDVKDVVPLFNSQQNGIWSLSYEKDTQKVKSTPVVHGKTALALVSLYAECIERDIISDTYSHLH